MVCILYKAYTYPVSLLSVILRTICDTVKGNESHVEDFNFAILTPLSDNSKMLTF